MHSGADRRKFRYVITRYVSMSGDIVLGCLYESGTADDPSLFGGGFYDLTLMSDRCTISRQMISALRGFVMCTFLRQILSVCDRRSHMGFIRYIKDEIAIIKDRDPAMHSGMEVFLYPSFRAILSYRLAHKLYVNHHYFLARFVSQHSARKTGIEIHPGAQIGKGLFIDHGNGVIIGETAIVGDNVTLYQGVTLGGTGKEQGKRHPTIGNNVMISAGAKVLGSFTVGENSKIGAGSVVLEEVPPNCTVVGVPGRVVKKNDISQPCEKLDQIHLPDPVKDDICNLQRANSELTNRLLDLENEIRRMKKANCEENKEAAK